MKWNMRVVLLGIGVLCLAVLTRCVGDDEVWILPVPTAVSPISTPTSLLGGSSMTVLGVDEVPSLWAGRETVIEPQWFRSPLEAGDLALFECELRPGGSLAAVDGRQFVLEYDEVVVLNWDAADLGPGWYEVLCRPQADGRIQFELFDAVGQDCAEGCGFVFIERWQIE